MRLRSSVVAGGLLVPVGGALVLAGPRPGAVLAAARDPAAWARRVGPDTAAVTVAGTLGWLVLLWLAAGLMLITAAGTAGATGRLADALACQLLPGSVRRIAAGLLGVSLTAAVAGCGSAATRPATHRPGPPPAAGHGLSGPARAGPGDVVEWPLSAATGAPAGHPAATAAAPRRPATSVEWPLGVPAAGPPSGGSSRTDRPHAAAPRPRDRVVVAPGDCLWLIAARPLGSSAATAQIAVMTRRWYAANRAVIGGDPDLLRPGEVLVGPPEPRQ
jgi:resuscitation-promoting factor RpfA